MKIYRKYNDVFHTTDSHYLCGCGIFQNYAYAISLVYRLGLSMTCISKRVIRTAHQMTSRKYDGMTVLKV